MKTMTASIIAAIGLFSASASAQTSATETTLPVYKATVDAGAFDDKESAMKKRGVTANPADVRLIVPGVDKDSIYNLIGPPHFGETVTRRWNYVLFFFTGNGTERQRCRVEFRFARPEGKRVVEISEVVWQEQSCADRVAAAN